jgi:protein TonB
MSALLYRFREPIAAANTLLLMALLAVLFTALRAPAPAAERISVPLELTLLMPEIEAPPVPQAPPVQQVQPAPQRQARPAAAVPQPVAQDVSAQAAVGEVDETERVPVIAPAPSLPAPPAPAFSKESAAAQADAPPAATPPTPPVDSGRAAQTRYVSRVRAYLQGIKRYPSGREASLQRPAGITVVAFTLRRDGALLEAHVEKGSGSMLLDNTALATVRRGSYPAFPDEAWAGSPAQGFTVELEFLPK